MLHRSITERDGDLIQIADLALADSVRRSGSWLACRPGCSQCCVGVFPMSQLDAHRLREGFLLLAQTDPARAAALRIRVQLAIESLREGFPGDFERGTVDDERPAFENFANDAVCPVLDPATQTCDLYASRPMTCRTFGPPAETQDGIGLCELCFVGAEESAIREAVMDTSFLDDEASLSDEVGGEATLIAMALRGL